MNEQSNQNLTEGKMSEQLIYCTACGKQFEKNAEMCPHCGKKKFNYFIGFLNKFSPIMNLLTFLFVVTIFIIVVQW